MKLAIGAVLTFFAVALAGQRAERITRLITSGQPAPGPVRGRLGPPGPSWSRSSASASLKRPLPGWPTSSPSGASWCC